MTTNSDAMKQVTNPGPTARNLSDLHQCCLGSELAEFKFIHLCDDGSFMMFVHFMIHLFIPQSGVIVDIPV